MREWLMQPDHMLWSLVFMPIVILVAALSVVAVRYHKLGRRRVQALAWWAPMMAVVVSYTGWLLRRSIISIVGDVIVAVALVSLWAFALDRAAAFDPRKLFGGGSRIEGPPDRHEEEQEASGDCIGGSMDDERTFSADRRT